MGIRAHDAYQAQTGEPTYTTKSPTAKIIATKTKATTTKAIATSNNANSTKVTTRNNIDTNNNSNKSMSTYILWHWVSWEEEDDIFAFIFRKFLKFDFDVLGKSLDKERMGRPTVNEAPVHRRFATPR